MALFTPGEALNLISPALDIEVVDVSLLTPGTPYEVKGVKGFYVTDGTQVEVVTHKGVQLTIPVIPGVVVPLSFASLVQDNTDATKVICLKG